MIYWGIALLICNVVILSWTMLRSERRVTGRAALMPLFAVGAMVGHLKACVETHPFTLLFALPAYVVTVLMFVVALVAWVAHLIWRRSGSVLTTWRRAKIIASAGGIILVLFSAERVAEFRAWAGLQTEAEPLRREQTQFDYRAMNWSKAFEALRTKLVEEYPFTEWRHVDWNALYAEYAPRIAEAEARHDQKAYYKALRGFVWSIRDGHVGVAGDDLGLKEAETGGSFGLRVVTLDGGPVVASYVSAAGPASRAGMQFGAEITGWNGESVDQALSRVEVIWSEFPPPTAERLRLERERFLIRAPVGSKADVAFHNREEHTTKTVTLVAIKEQEQEHPVNELREFLLSSAVETRTLGGGYGYIKIKYELPALLSIYPEIKIRRALGVFLRSHAAGVILDVRGNRGGSDAMVPRMVGFFVTQEQIYEFPAVLNHTTHRFEPVKTAAVRLLPEQPHYGGKVAVLIDENTISSGEGIPLTLKRLPNVRVLGRHGTGGFFAIDSKEVMLPGGYRVYFPQAQSLDGQERIQIDSDGTHGGIEPDIRPPLNDVTLDATYRDGRDLVMEEAIKWLEKPPR